MNDALTEKTRAMRPSLHRLSALSLLRPWLAHVAFATLAALPLTGFGHQTDGPAPANVSAPATAVELTGRVTIVVVVDHTQGTTRGYPMLEIADGRRYRLEGTASFPADAWMTVTGRLQGHTLTAFATREQPAPAGAKAAPQRAQLVGTIRMFHLDYEDGTSEFGYTMFADGGRRNIIDIGMPLPGIENGTRAVVSGVVNASGFIVVDTIEILGSPAQQTQSKVLAAASTMNYTVIPLKWPTNTSAPFTYNADPASWPIATITSTAFGGAPTKSVAEYYKEVSFGAQLVGGVVANSANTWLKAEAPLPASCTDLNTVLNEIETRGNAASSLAGFNPNAFPGQHYVLDRLPSGGQCGWAGLGYIGFPLAYSKGTASLGVVGHEWGHNFGLYHAGNLDCGTNIISTSGCTVTEYGDPFVIMGNIQSGHFNAFQKNALGYIPGGVATHSTGTATYNLGPIELPGQSLYGVKIPTSKANRTYWLEFRQPIGFDATVPGTGALGTQVRVARPTEFVCGSCSASSDDTEIIDMTPATTTFTDAALLVSQIYTDTAVSPNITIEVLSASASSVSVKVTAGSGPSSSTTTMASTINPSTQGQSVTFTATVTANAPTGTVSFKDGGVAIAGCSGVALAGSGNSRTAGCTTSALAVGVHSIVGDYSGDAGNLASSSSPLSQTVKTPSTTSVVSSLNPSTVGASVNFTATVTGVAPTGTVSFTANAVTICAGASVSGSGNSRTAVCTTSALAAGTQPIVATYSGNSANGGSTSAPLSQVVNGSSAVATTTTMASTLNPSTQGQSVTFTATVTGSAPTGSVNFKDGGSSLSGCSAVALTGSGNSRTAACATSALAVGVHNIVGDYSGDAGNATSNSSPLSQTVKTPSTTSVASSLNPSTVGASVNFTATVTGTAPTGTVAFTANAATICAAVNVSGSGNSRTAVCTTSALAAGTQPIVATYSGDSANGGSTSAPLSQVVNGSGGGAKVATTTGLASSANPTTEGSLLTFLATVTGTAPTGAVGFTAGGVTISGCASVILSGGGNSPVAGCATNALVAGTTPIVATYLGDTGNLTSSSAPLAQVINAVGAVPTVTIVSSAVDPSPANISALLTALVVANPAVSGGTVAFTANGSPIAGCSSVPVVAVGNQRRAQCNANLVSGAYSIVGSYSGSGASLPSVSQVYSQVVSFAALGNTFQFASAAYSVSETAGNVVVTVTRIGDMTGSATVGYTTAPGSASASDYTPVSGVLSWLPNDSSTRTITIPIATDAVNEGNETFTVSLSSPQFATLGAISTTTVTIVDDESAATSMPGVATVVQHPYGALSVQGATLVGNTISNLSKDTVIQLGSIVGTPPNFAKIDFQGLDIGAGNTLTIRSGAPGQIVYLTNVNGLASTIAGSVLAQGIGVPPPFLIVQSPNGLTIGDGGRVIAQSGLTLDTLGGTFFTGQPLLNQGVVDGGSTLTLRASKVNGGGLFYGNAMSFVTFGNLNNPANGSHFIQNGLQLYPGAGSDISVTLTAYGAAPQFFNLLMHGNATLSMPSQWPLGSPLPLNNRPVMPGEIRPAGVLDPAYGGSQMIIQATGSLTLDGGVSGDFVFPGGIVLRTNGFLDIHGVALDNGWTTTGAIYQGLFLESQNILDTSGATAIAIRTNDNNWANFGSRPVLPVTTWQLKRMLDGTAQFQSSDALVPHLNFYGIVTEAAAGGQCFPCLVNPQVIDMSFVP